MELNEAENRNNGVNSVERWGLFEVTMEGDASGNPFTEVELSAIFRCGNLDVKVNGFYDGEGIYRIRFMPDEKGVWTFTTSSNRRELDGIEGCFDCIAPSANNHGPVTVYEKYHFSYADGTRYYPIGTTSYGCVHQKKELAAQTLSSLKNSPFNKIRMCILPHHSVYSEKNITAYPFPGSPETGWDYTKFNPEYFKMVDERVKALMNLGIEADIILFHPYNTPWGFDAMEPEVDDRYLRYIINRIGAFRNVWWSLANEFDFLEMKKKEDWDRFGEIILKEDVYKRLCSIHNGTVLFEHWKLWITHASVQDGLAVSETGRAVALRNAYHKPVIYDEVCYEGNFKVRWGNLSPEEFIYRFWQGMMAGAYVGHGEVYRYPNQTEDFVWTGVGGTLRGVTNGRIQFLKDILEQAPIRGLEPIDKWWYNNICGLNGEFYLIYFGKEQPESWLFEIPSRDTEIAEGTEFKVDILDTWEMKTTPIEEVFRVCKKNQYIYSDIYNRTVSLPGKPYIALRIIKEKVNN